MVRRRGCGAAPAAYRLFNATFAQGGGRAERRASHDFGEALDVDGGGDMPDPASYGRDISTSISPPGARAHGFGS
jgi:hypothetical protein